MKHYEYVPFDDKLINMFTVEIRQRYLYNFYKRSAICIFEIIVALIGMPYLKGRYEFLLYLMGALITLNVIEAFVSLYQANHISVNKEEIINSIINHLPVMPNNKVIILLADGIIRQIEDIDQHDIQIAKNGLERLEQKYGSTDTIRYLQSLLSSPDNNIKGTLLYEAFCSTLDNISEASETTLTLNAGENLCYYLHLD